MTMNYPYDPRAAVERIVQAAGRYGVTVGAVGTLFRDYKSTRGRTWIGSAWAEHLDVLCVTHNYRRRESLYRSLH
jgi:hypothetical protein